MSKDGKLTRGDRRRNERLTRLRSIVDRDHALLGVDLASGKQAAVLTDHDSRVLARRMFTGDAWIIEEILDWAAPIVAQAGFSGLVVGCEPTGHRWKPLLERTRARGVELVCVNPMLVARGREEEDFTRDRSDFKDATIIARRVADRRCYVPYQLEGHWCRLRHLGARRGEAPQVWVRLVVRPPRLGGLLKQRTALPIAPASCSSPRNEALCCCTSAPIERSHARLPAARSSCESSVA